MQDNPNFTRGGKRFRGNIKDIEQPRVRRSTDTPERFNEGPKEPFVLLLDRNSQTTSPPEHNTLAGSSQEGPVGEPQTPGGGQENPSSVQQNQINSSSAQQNSPLHRNRMVDDIKLPIFRGTGFEDPKQHFFLCESVWHIKQVQNDDIKRAQ